MYLIVMDRNPSLRGLSEEQALSRLRRFGPNDIRQPQSRTIVDIVRATLKEPMFLLLLGAAATYLLVGNLGEGIFMLAGATVSFGLVIVQEARSERALQALRDLAEPKARVVRDGVTQTIAASKLVPGDIILVSEGHRVPADAVLRVGDVLEVDESTLSGESAPQPRWQASRWEVGQVFSPAKAGRRRCLQARSWFAATALPR
jgi:Ca2+-transporting ATPase